MAQTVQSEFKLLKHRQQLLGILLFSLVTIVIWVAISLVTSQQTTSISPELLQMAQPLNPSLDLAVVSEIEQKNTYDPNQLSNFPIYTLVSADELAAQSTQTSSNNESTGLGQNLTPLLPSPSPSPSPSASPSAETSTATNSATPSPSPSPNPEQNL